MIYIAQATIPVDSDGGMKWVEQIQNPQWLMTLSQQARELIIKLPQPNPGP